jgi:hypothetical protein
MRSFSHLTLSTLWGLFKQIPSTEFLEDCHSYPLAEIFRSNTIQIWHPISPYVFSNAKITSDVLTASLNNSFKDYWHLCVKNMY